MSINTNTEKAAAIRAAFALHLAVAEAIREATEIPSGHLYAVICHRVSLDNYEAIVESLIRTGLVTKSGHLLRWVGPGPAGEVPRG